MGQRWRGGGQSTLTERRERDDRGDKEVMERDKGDGLSLVRYSNGAPRAMTRACIASASTSKSIQSYVDIPSSAVHRGFKSFDTVSWRLVHTLACDPYFHGSLIFINLMTMCNACINAWQRGVSRLLSTCVCGCHKSEPGFLITGPARPVSAVSTRECQPRRLPGREEVSSSVVYGATLKT